MKKLKKMKTDCYRRCLKHCSFDSFSKFIFVISNFKHDAWQTYLFITKLYGFVSYK